MEQQADPRTQGAFDMATKQALAMLTSEAGSEMIAQVAQAKGPDVAITQALQMAAAQVQEAASSSGVELPPEVFEASQRAVGQVLVAMMAEAGFTDDPEGLKQTVEAQIAGGHAEDDADEQGGPSDMDEDDAPRGVLAQRGM